MWPELALTAVRPVEKALTEAALGQGPGSFLLRSEHLRPAASISPLCRFFKRISQAYETDLVLNLQLHKSTSVLAGAPELFSVHTQGTGPSRAVLREPQDQSR